MNTVGKIEQLTKGIFGAPPPSGAEKISEPKIQYLGDLQRLELKPGDMLVLSVDEHLSQEVAVRLSAMIEEATGGTKAIVLGKGMKLGAISVEAA